MIKKYFYSIVFILVAHSAISQNKKDKSNTHSTLDKNHIVKCATVENELLLQRKNKSRLNTQEFENWLATKIQNYKKTTTERLRQTENVTNVVTIPVVVHVIHNGDPIGSDENITDEQIQSQITVLNQDFRRALGTPGFNSNPVGADTEIEFCLASRDPQGLFTNGIVRHQIDSGSYWEMAQIDELVKPQTQWNPNEYLNIWVVSKVAFVFNGIVLGEILGYAQFPSASGLAGLQEDEGLSETDGVVIGYQNFGSALLYPEGNYSSTTESGRTVTHEVGHFFGLRHIWGDDNGGCDSDDYCDDTPKSANFHQGCPVGIDSCPASPGLDMIENYMDYTDCMNVFTQDQKSRMMTVLQNSPRRVSLTSSLGCQPGLVLDNDGSLEIINSSDDTCSTTFTPVVQLKNVGNNDITSAEILYQINNETNTFNWNGNLSYGESEIINLPSLNVNQGDNVFTVDIISINTIDDENDLNNLKTKNLQISVFNAEELTVSITTDDYGDETFWTLTDDNNTIVASGGPYANNTINNQAVLVQNDSCYEFTIYDTYGDGICCVSGNGSYSITTDNSQTIASGGQFSDFETKKFGIEQNLNNSEISLSEIKTYPNPVETTLNVELHEKIKLENIVIYNTLGQLVFNKQINSNQNLSIDTTTFKSGVYYLKLIGKDSSNTIKFIRK